jgi:muramidase (phage lysozyme)
MHTRAVALALVALAGLAWSRTASAAVDESTGLDEVDMGDLNGAQPVGLEVPATDDYQGDVDPWWTWGPAPLPGDLIAYLGDSDVLATDPDRFLSALLYTIRCCEHLYPQNVANDACYQIFYGGAVFDDLSDHPVLTGEKRGVPLPPTMCRNAGYASGVCVSTAAGAYQITVPTWRQVREAGSWGPRLEDFGAESQDEAARRILLLAGAGPAIQAGDLTTAMAKASKRWASLPGATTKQAIRPVEWAVARFNDGLSLA